MIIIGYITILFNLIQFYLIDKAIGGV